MHSVGSVKADCRRQHAREGVALAGSAYGLARSRSVIVSDLSPDGAQLDGRDLPAPGEELVMVVGSVDAFAKVVWRRDDKCGVHFDEIVTLRKIARMKQEAEWTEVAGWYR
jgi:hypothetical protein